MAGLRFVGPDVTTDPEVVYKDYVTGIKAADMTSTQIDDAIDAGLNSYATRTYVDTQDGLLATQGYIDAQDALRVPLSAKDVNNGVSSLDASGRAPQARINVPSTQRYVRGPWTPAAYNASPISGSSEQTVYPCTVTDPGFPYKLVVFGIADTHGYLGETPTITVRADDATNGSIVAYGVGASDSMETALSGDNFNRANTTEPQGLGPDWEMQYTDGSGTIGGGAGWLGITNNRTDWHESGKNMRICRLRNLSANSKYSATDWQKVTANVVNRGGDVGANGQWLRLYGRVNDTFTSYVGIECTYRTQRWFYANGGTETYLTDAFNATLTAGADTILGCGDATNPRRFTITTNGVLVNTYDDNVGVTAMGANNRGWGFGVRVTNQLEQTQTPPPSLDGIWMTDNAENFAPIHISPYPQYLSSGSARTGATTLYVRLSKLGSGSVAASAYKPKLHVMCVPA